METAMNYLPTTEKQWTAEEFWEIQNGDWLLRFPFEDLL